MRRQTTPRTWIGTEAQVVRHVRVCGEGHLAAATRIELERQGIHRDSDYLLPSLRPTLIIACADSEADESLNDAAQRAFEEGSPLLLCCLAGPVVRLGPLIEPCAYLADPARTQTAHNPTSPAGPHRASLLPSSPTPVATSAAPPAEPSHLAYPPRRSRNSRDKADCTLHPDARLAALLVSAQALNFLLGARNQCVLDRVVELHPGSMESRGYRVFHN